MYENDIEGVAREIAARICRTWKDPMGLQMPEKVWQQALRMARHELGIGDSREDPDDSDAIEREYRKNQPFSARWRARVADLLRDIAEKLHP